MKKDLKACYLMAREGRISSTALSILPMLERELYIAIGDQLATCKLEGADLALAALLESENLSVDLKREL